MSSNIVVVALMLIGHVAIWAWGDEEYVDSKSIVIVLLMMLFFCNYCGGCCCC